MKFAYFLTKCGTPEAFQSAVPEHVAYMDSLHDKGVLIAGGPFADGQGGMVLIEVADEATAKAIAENDPFITRGVETFTLRKWDVLTPVAPDKLTRDGQ